MPMRGGSLGYGIPGGTQSGSTTVNGYTVPQDLTLTGSRTGAQPAEYVAASNVEFTGEFESASNDEFSAYIADASYAGTGNQSNGGNGTNLAGGCRYGFNGKENDGDVKGDGNQLDYGKRIYDSRMGRWLSLDPLQAKYASSSPYIFTGNNPVAFIDVDGQDTISINKRIISYSMLNGFRGGSSGVSYEIKKATGKDVFYYNVINVTISALGNTNTAIKTTQFYPNGDGPNGQGKVFKGTGLTKSDGALPGMTLNDDDYSSLARLAPDGLIEELKTNNPEKYGGLGLTRAGFQVNAAGKDFAGGVLLLSEGVNIFTSLKNLRPILDSKAASYLESSAKNPDITLDCSDHASGFNRAIEGGQILELTPKSGKWMNGIEFGEKTEFIYHQVFEKNGYVYDPMFGSAPVKTIDFFRTYEKLNPNGLILKIIKK